MTEKACRGARRLKLLAPFRRSEIRRTTSDFDEMTSSPPPLPPGAYVGPVLVPAESVPERQGALGFMSPARREGDWVLPRLFRAVAIMGEVQLDLTRVRLAPGTSTIEVLAIVGEVRLLVPHHVRIECDISPGVGSTSVRHVAKTVPAPEAPLIRITGSTWLGSVRIKVVDPSAPGWLETMRARWAGY